MTYPYDDFDDDDGYEPDDPKNPAYVDNLLDSADAARKDGGNP